MTASALKIETPFIHFFYERVNDFGKIPFIILLSLALKVIIYFDNWQQSFIF